MNKLLYCIFGILLLTLAESAVADPVVRYVDVDRILRESPLAVESASKLKKEFSARAEAITNLQKKLDGMQSANGASQSEVNSLRLQLDQMRRDFSEDGERRKGEELESLQNRMNKAVEAVAVSEQCDLVLYTGLAYINKKKDLDITDKVMQRMSSITP